MDKSRIIKYCNRVIEVSLCAVVFYIPISNALIESFAGLAITAWLVKKIISGDFLKRLFPRDFMSLPIWIYIAVMLVSAALSSSRIISAKAFVFKYTEYLLLFFITSEIKDARVLRNILIVFVFSVFLVNLDGIQQHFTSFDFLRQRTRVIAERINGPFSTPNDFSNYLVAVLPVVACLSFIKFKRKWLRPFLAGLSFIILLCLVLSATRAAWIAVVLALPLALFLRQRALSLSGLVFIILIACFMPFLPQFSQSRITHFFYTHESGYFHRELLWKMAVDMLSQRPFFGQGLGTFMFNFERFRPLNYPWHWEISYAHNCFLQMAAETGMFGLLSFVGVISVMFHAAFSRVRSMARNNNYYIICGVCLGIFTYLVNSFFDTSLYSLSLSVLFWMMMGLCVAAIKMSES
ncbi:MAG: O-antigen ligase family protein [Candidatus Omnitrophota bacterium]|nr:O-antigen ligase family protein [Candidatus Omnitrophota bacterium]